MGIFSLDNAFGRFMDKVGKWIALNFLCLLCCVPIVTIGPAVTALYAVSLKMARGEDVSIVQCYFAALKENFKKGLVIHIIMVLIAAVMVLSLYYLRQLQGEYTFYRYFKWVVYGIALVYAMVLTYVYPLLAAFENTIRGTLRNALLLPVTHIGWTALMLTLSIGPLLLCYFIPYIIEFGLFFYLLCGFAVTGFIHSKFFLRIFAQYSQTDDEEE